MNTTPFPFISLDYNTPGWIQRDGVLKLVTPYVTSRRGLKLSGHECIYHPDGQLRDYILFAHATGNIADELLNVLTDKALTDRQNHAATLGAFLQLIKDHPQDMWFSGYLITEVRFDERVSVDTITIRDTLLPARDASEVWECLMHKHWLEDAYDEPDEIEHIASPDGEGTAWKLWWD